MTLPSVSSDRALSIYLALAQYPILSTQIRARMRRELFNRGVITPQAFESEVREYAIRSQAREALHNPFDEEPANVWELRLIARARPPDRFLFCLQPALRAVRADREGGADRARRSGSGPAGQLQPGAGPPGYALRAGPGDRKNARRPAQPDRGAACARSRSS